MEYEDKFSGLSKYESNQNAPFFRDLFEQLDRIKGKRPACGEFFGRFLIISM